MNPLYVQLDVGGTWRICLFFGMALCSLAFTAKFFKKSTISVWALWNYAIISSLFITEFPMIPFAHYNTAFEATAGQTLTEIILIPLAVLAIPNNLIKFFLNILIGIEIILLWSNGSGLMVSPSFDCALMALFVPFSHPIILVGSLVTILTHHGSTAQMILGAQLIGLAIKDKNFRLPTIITMPILAVISWYHHSAPMLDGMERLAAYKRFMGYWWEQPWSIRLLGFGPGTFIWFSMLIDHFKKPIFLQMHSDWLQCTFELGLIGIWLIVAFMIQMIQKTKMLPQILGVAAFCLTYHPLRFFPTMFLIAFIFKLVVEEINNSLTRRSSGI